MEEPTWWERVVWILLSPVSVATTVFLVFMAFLGFVLWDGQ